MTQLMQLQTCNEESTQSELMSLMQRTMRLEHELQKVLQYSQSQ